MKSLRIVAVVLIMMLALCACQASPVPYSPEDSSTTTTEEPVDDTTEDTAFLEETEEMIDGMQQTGPQPGYYVVSSVGNNGDVLFYDTIDPVNGYLLLNEDNTGIMLFDGVEDSLTWDDEALYWRDQILPCVTISYYDTELDRKDDMVMVYFLDEMISVCLRPVAE